MGGPAASASHLPAEHYDNVVAAGDGAGGHRQQTAADGAGSQQQPLRVDDLIVFIALESLGTLAITLNVCLCVVLLRHKYLNRASFVLMLSLALADVLHGLVTTSFFYPPILLRQSPVPSIGVRLFNILDWTAWSITLTHMSAMCLDRLLAIMMYGRYNQLITVGRARKFTLACWTAFLTLNSAYILAQFCCLITPLRESHFYTFGYGEFESEEQRNAAPLGGANLFKLTYTPLELATLAVLSISNPITLIQLYRRHKRKMALRIQRSSQSGVGDAVIRRASTMLLEVSMRMGSKHVSSEVQQVASRRASRQQQRILLQISVVAIIFYLYMSVYYTLYHVLNVSNKWVVLFNSFFYSTTHMINPVIYFSLNKDMRVQLIRAIADFLNWICCVGSPSGVHGTSSIYGRKRAESSSLGVSGMPKSSPGEPTRTYRPSGVAQSGGWLLSPTDHQPHNNNNNNRHHRPSSEKTPLLRMPSAPPPSTASSAFFSGNDDLLAQIQQQSQQQHDRNNNNGPLNNNTMGQAQRLQMVALAQQVADAVKQQQQQQQMEQKDQPMPTEAGWPRESSLAKCAVGCSASTSADQLRGTNPSLMLLSSRETSSNFNLVITDEEGTQQDGGDQAEQLELDLVSSWSVEEAKEPAAAAVSGWQKEALDGLSRLRGLGAFLAERLAREAAKQDRAWGRARQQRNSLLDALIRALIEKEGNGEEDGSTGRGRDEEARLLLGGRNGLLLTPETAADGWQRKKSHSVDLGQPAAVPANGWPGMGSTEGGRPCSDAPSAAHHHGLSCSATDLVGQRKYGMVKYQQVMKNRDGGGASSVDEERKRTAGQEGNCQQNGGERREADEEEEEAEEEEDMDEVIFL